MDEDPTSSRRDGRSGTELLVRQRAGAPLSEDATAPEHVKQRGWEEVSGVTFPAAVIEKYDWATDVVAGTRIFKNVIARVAYLWHYPQWRWWIQRNGRILIASISAQFPEAPTIRDQWRARERILLRRRGFKEYAETLVEFCESKLKAHGLSLHDEPEDLAPISPAGLELVRWVDPGRSPRTDRQSMIWFVDRLAERLRQDQPVFVAVTMKGLGSEAFRTGKTALRMEVEALLAMEMGWPYDFRYDVVYQHDRGRFRSFIFDTSRHVVRAVDEIENLLYLRRTGSAENIDFIQRFAEKPKQGQAWFISGASLYNLDKAVVSDDVTHWVQIVEPRRRAVVFEKADIGLDFEQMKAQRRWGRRLCSLTWSDVPPSVRRAYGGPPGYAGIVDYLNATEHGDPNEPSPVDERLGEDPDWLLEDVLRPELIAFLERLRAERDAPLDGQSAHTCAPVGACIRGICPAYGAPAPTADRFHPRPVA